MQIDVTKGTVICTNGDSANTMLRLGGVNPLGVNGFDLICSAGEMQKLSCSFVGRNVGYSDDPYLDLESLKAKYDFVFVNKRGVGATAYVFWKGQRVLNLLSVEIQAKAQGTVTIKLRIYETPNELLPEFDSYVIIKKMERPTYKLGQYFQIVD